MLWLAAAAASVYVIIASSVVIGWIGFFSLVPVLAYWPLQVLAFRRPPTMTRIADVLVLGLLVLDIVWALATLAGH